jgi:integrase
VQALRQAFRLAQRQGRFRSIPYFPQLKEENTRQGFFERGEFEKVASRLREPIADIAWFAFFSGWRKGEVLSLRWEDVDRHAKEIRLRTSKNGDGRVLPLAGNLWEILERRWVAREYERNGVTTLADFVFHRKGRQVGSFYKSWRTVCKEVGVDGRLFHDLRRTAGRNMIRAGVPETVARSITGHRTRSMFDRYNITSERDKVEALRKIDAHFESQPTTSKVATIRPTK